MSFESQQEGLQNLLDQYRDVDQQRLFELLQDVDRKLSVIEERVGELEGKVESLRNWRGRLRVRTEQL